MLLEVNRGGKGGSDPCLGTVEPKEPAAGSELLPFKHNRKGGSSVQLDLFQGCPPAPDPLELGRGDGNRHRAAAFTSKSKTAQGADRQSPWEQLPQPSLASRAWLCLGAAQQDLLEVASFFSPGRGLQNLLLPGSISCG